MSISMQLETKAMEKNCLSMSDEETTSLRVLKISFHGSNGLVAREHFIKREKTETVIGRDKDRCDLPINLNVVSTKQAIIKSHKCPGNNEETSTADSLLFFTIKNLGARNPTVLDGVKLVQQGKEHVICHGSVVHIADRMLRFHYCNSEGTQQDWKMLQEALDKKWHAKDAGIDGAISNAENFSPNAKKPKCHNKQTKNSIVGATNVKTKSQTDCPPQMVPTTLMASTSPSNSNFMLPAPLKADIIEYAQAMTNLRFEKRDRASFFAKEAVHAFNGKSEAAEALEKDFQGDNDGCKDVSLGTEGSEHTTDRDAKGSNDGNENGSLDAKGSEYTMDKDANDGNENGSLDAEDNKCTIDGEAQGSNDGDNDDNENESFDAKGSEHTTDRDAKGSNDGNENGSLDAKGSEYTMDKDANDGNENGLLDAEDNEYTIGGDDQGGNDLDDDNGKLDSEGSAERNFERQDATDKVHVDACEEGNSGKVDSCLLRKIEVINQCVACKGPCLGHEETGGSGASATLLVAATLSGGTVLHPSNSTFAVKQGEVENKDRVNSNDNGKEAAQPCLFTSKIETKEEKKARMAASSARALEWAKRKKPVDLKKFTAEQVRLLLSHRLNAAPEKSIDEMTIKDLELECAFRGLCTKGKSAKLKTRVKEAY